MIEYLSITRDRLHDRLSPSHQDHNSSTYIHKDTDATVDLTQTLKPTTSTSRNISRATRTQEVKRHKTNTLNIRVKQIKQALTTIPSQLTSANMASLSKQTGTSQRRGGGGDEPRPVVRKSSHLLSLPGPSLTVGTAWSGSARHNRGPKPAPPPDKPITPWS